MKVTVKHKINPDIAAGIQALLAGGKLRGKIGWTADAVYPDEDNHPGPLVATVARKNEFGGLNNVDGKVIVVPPRPALRITIAERKQRWLDEMVIGAKMVLQNNIDFKNVLDSVTRHAVSDVRHTVQALVPPPISPATYRRRIGQRILHPGLPPISTTPLYDTHRMMNTLTNEVVSK